MTMNEAHIFIAYFLSLKVGKVLS